MKQSFKKMVLPSLTFLLAIGLAFATSGTSGVLDGTTPIDGYIDNPQPCKVRVDCQAEPNEICTSGGQQAKAFNAAGTSCDVKVYRIEP